MLITTRPIGRQGRRSVFKGRKVLIATPEFPPDDWGGLARTVWRVANYSRDLGLEVHVARLTVQGSALVLLDENRVTEERDGLTYHKITVGHEDMSDRDRSIWDCPHTLSLRMMYASLEMLHREIGFDVVNSFFLYPIGYPAVILARRYGLPSAVMLLGNDIKKYTFSPEKVGVCRAGLERADIVTSLSQDLVDMADALTPIKPKARVIHAAVEIPDQAWTPRPEPRPFKVGCAGIFKYAKGLPYLFKAMARVREDHEASLELVGVIRPGEREMFEHMVERTGLGDGLTVRDPLPHDQVPDWLMSLDAFVLPSVSEGCPHILMEALAAGTPSVSTLVGATGQLIDHGRTGRLVPWADSDALARELAWVIDHPAEAAEMGRAGRQAMAEEFNAGVEAGLWREVYKELITGG